MSENAWIEHDGGPMPVAGDVRVHVRTADGWEDKAALLARFWGHWWTHQGIDPDDNIIAYRLIRPLGMSGGVPAGERREQIADIIADHVSGPVVQDWDIQQAHRQDQLTAADKIAALFPTPTPPIEGRDADASCDCAAQFYAGPTPDSHQDCCASRRGRDADVERVARAMCVADGLDPDEHIVGGQATGFEDFGPLWQAEDRSEGQLGFTDYVRLARAALQALGERG